LEGLHLQSQPHNAVAEVSISFAAAVFLFILSWLWLRFSELAQMAARRRMGRVTPWDPAPEWSRRFTKYFGALFLMAAGIYAFILAIKAVP
jgi:hypothetical protein